MQEERARKAAVRKSKMDADLDAESADLQEKKGVSPVRLLCIYRTQSTSVFVDHYHA